MDKIYYLKEIEKIGRIYPKEEVKSYGYKIENYIKEKKEKN